MNQKQKENGRQISRTRGSPSKIFTGAIADLLTEVTSVHLILPRENMPLPRKDLPGIKLSVREFLS